MIRYLIKQNTGRKSFVIIVLKQSGHLLFEEMFVKTMLQIRVYLYMESIVSIAYNEYIIFLTKCNSPMI